MHDHFLTCLNNPDLADHLLHDFAATLRSFTETEVEARQYANGIIEIYKKSPSNKAEQVVREYVMTIPNFVDKFKDLNVSRSVIVSEQILKELEIGSDGQVLDFGCGNGLVGNEIAKLGVKVQGCDIVNYLNENTHLDFLKFNDYNIPVQDGFFTQGWANSVIHHDANPELVVKEISRVVKNRFILIEDTLRTDLVGGVDLHRERMFANDYFYNRLLTFEDIPVPGNFKLKQEWIELFQNNGWTLKSEEDLGPATILKAIYRHKFIFER